MFEILTNRSVNEVVHFEQLGLAVQRVSTSTKVSHWQEYEI